MRRQVTRCVPAVRCGVHSGPDLPDACRTFNSTALQGSLIGVGSHGRVYRGVHKPTQRVVALKKVCSGEEEGVCTAAMREIAVMKELQSPCIIRLYDVFPHKKRLMLVLEFMAADLDVLIKDPSVPLGPPSIKAYMRALLLALSLLHGQGIIHRDIKPNNILISSKGEPKLADFGLARICHSPGARCASL